MTSLAFLNSRWVATVASAYLESNAGLQYVFGDISGALRSKLRYTQRQIDGLGTAKDCGTAAIDVLAGFMYDSLGAPVTLTTIAVLNATGFLLVRAVYQEQLPASYSSMVLYTAIGFGGNGAMLLPGLVTTLGNFPEARGMVTGLLKSVFFLCASLYTEWFALVGDNTAVFLLVLALLPAAAALACIPVLRTHPHPPGDVALEGLATRRVFFIASGFTLALAVFMACVVMLQSLHPTTLGVGTAFVPLAFTLMAALMGFYCALPALHAALRDAAAADAARGAGGEPLLAAGEARPAGYGTLEGGGKGAGEGGGEAAGGGGGAVAGKAEDEHYVGDAANITLFQCWQRLDYWLLYSMYTVNLSVGLTLSNNLEPIAVAKGATEVAGYVAISSVATCIGCLLGGHMGEVALDPAVGIPRPFCLIPCFVAMALGSLVVAIGSRGALFAAVALTMFAYGANLCILPAILHERYGQRHYGSIWAFSQTAMVTSSMIFATGLASSVYERHASLDAAGVQTCLGNACFTVTFLVLMALALLGALIAGVHGRVLSAFYALLTDLRRGKPSYFAALGFGPGARGGGGGGATL